MGSQNFFSMIYGLIGFMIGGLIIFLLLNPKRQKVIKLNHETEIQNIKLQEELKFNQTEINRTIEEINANNVRIKELGAELQQLHCNYVQSQKEIDELIQNYEINQKKIAEEDVERAIENFRNELKIIQHDSVVEFVSNQEQIRLEIAAKTAELNALTAMVSAAIEANKRAEEMRSKQDFYKLQISDEDIAEIQVLRTVELKLRNPEPLNKVIYKYYYENAYNALVGRLFGQNKDICGIYKITNIQNQMCYIGQSNSVRERFRQHIKRGVGAETPTKNKLYPALKSIGVENFTFELLEECSQEELNEREQFWISFYQSQEYGYNATKGG